MRGGRAQRVETADSRLRARVSAHPVLLPPERSACSRASFRSQAFAGESVVADSLGGALDPASSPPLAHPSRTNDEATALAVSQDVFHHRSAAIPGVSSRSPPDT